MNAKIMNLYTDDSLSGMYVSAYINSLARHYNSAVTVWRGTQDRLRAELLRLTHMIRLSILQGKSLPERRVYIYNLDPHDDAVFALRNIDPNISIQRIDMTVPVGYLVQLKAALGFQCWDDVEALCAQKLYLAFQGRWEEVSVPEGRILPLIRTEGTDSICEVHS